MNRVDNIRNLGVHFDTQLLVDKHTDSTVTKAYIAMTSLLQTCINITDIKPIKKLYCSLVCSLLENASQVWNPSYEVKNHELEPYEKSF